MRAKPRSGETGRATHDVVTPLRGFSVFSPIRGFLADSSPTATVVLALRACCNTLSGDFGKMVLVDHTSCGDDGGDDAAEMQCDAGRARGAYLFSLASEPRSEFRLQAARAA